MSEVEEVKSGETAEQRFVRLAELRVRNALKSLRILSNCSNRSIYSYTPSQVRSMFDTLEAKLSESRARFEKTERKEDAFSLAPNL